MNGIVLRRINFEETSFILTVLFNDGFKSVMVKGAKKKNSNKLSISEPLSLVDFTLSKSEKFPCLIEGVMIDSFEALKNDLDKLSIASIMLEYCYLLKEDSNDSSKIYNLLLHSLEDLKHEEDNEIVLFSFEIILLKYLGSIPTKEYLTNEYHASNVLIQSIEKILNGDNSNIEKKELRNFFINYYEKECGMILKSKKIYLDIIK